MAYVVYQEHRGVYLGSCLGLGFWSKLDTAGQTHAVTFPSVGEAEADMVRWVDGRPHDVRVVEVVAQQDGYAPEAACVTAGLPGWVGLMGETTE